MAYQVIEEKVIANSTNLKQALKFATHLNKSMGTKNKRYSVRTI
jgi:hypothetical protein